MLGSQGCVPKRFSKIRLRCSRCKVFVTPVVTQVAMHNKATCPRCNIFIKFLGKTEREAQAGIPENGGYPERLENLRLYCPDCDTLVLPWNESASDRKAIRFFCPTCHRLLKTFKRTPPAFAARDGKPAGQKIRQRKNQKLKGKRRKGIMK